MGNNNRNNDAPIGSEQSSEQPLSARNQFQARFERLMKAIGAKNETDLARILGIKQQSVAGWKKRKQFPAKWITVVCDLYGISSDWILFGEGPMKREVRTDQDKIAEGLPPYGRPIALDLNYLVDEMRDIFQTYEIKLSDTDAFVVFYRLIELFTRELEKRGIE